MKEYQIIIDFEPDVKEEMVIRATEVVKEFFKNSEFNSYVSDVW